MHSIVCSTALVLSLLVSLTVAVVFENRCELFSELTEKYKIPDDEAAVWTCLAETHSAYDSRKQIDPPFGEQSDYGLFQINGLEWCSDGVNRCNLDCQNLVDDDLTDDLKCARYIREVEGYKAWGGYERCKNRVEEYRQKNDCKVAVDTAPKDTKFSRCELARELYYEHGVPFDEIATWVCIAEEESNLEANSQSMDSYGLFRVSSKWWCSEDPYNLDKACKIPCDHLLDEQIADDVRCARTIYNETAMSRMDRDGFRAWGSYMRKCYSKSRSRAMVRDCFDKTTEAPVLPAKTKAYLPCELARELHQKHGISREEVPSYVCIAFHDSRLVTSSQRFPHGHGLLQLRDLWWCNNGDGKAKDCDLTCDQLRDIDIADDIACSRNVLRNHEGFIGWNTFAMNCTEGKAEAILNGCEYGQATIATMTTTTTTTEKPVEIPAEMSSRNMEVETQKKMYNQCSLVQELVNRHKMSKRMAATFTCIAKEESMLDQRSMTSHGSATAYGLFRITDTWWCSRTEMDMKPCGPCFQFVDDDIADDVICAVKIYNDTAGFKPSGYEAWASYERACSDEDENLKTVKNCFMDVSSSNWIYPNVVKPMNNQVESPGGGTLVFQRPVQFIPVSGSSNSSNPSQSSSDPGSSNPSSPERPANPPSQGQGSSQENSRPQSLNDQAQQTTQRPAQATTTTQRQSDTTQQQNQATPAPEVERVENTSSGDYLIYFTNPSMTLKVTAQIEESRVDGGQIRVIPISKRSDGKFGVSILVEPKQNDDDAALRLK